VIKAFPERCITLYCSFFWTFSAWERSIHSWFRIY